MSLGQPDIETVTTPLPRSTAASRYDSSVLASLLTSRGQSGAMLLAVTYLASGAGYSLPIVAVPFSQVDISRQSWFVSVSNTSSTMGSDGTCPLRCALSHPRISVSSDHVRLDFV